MNKPEIAIIGVSCRLPKGINNESEFWNALKNKKDLITEVSNEKFDKRKYLHQNINKPGKCYTFAAGIIEDNEYFDASFFNISKKEAKNMDPQQRIMLELSWDALENSGYNPLNLKGTSCGVYLGIYDMDHSLNGASDVSALESYSPMGGSMSIAANRISYFFDFNGASMAIDTACSSSMVALHQACVSIQTGENDMALVGGINLLQHPQPFIGLSKANMLSREGRCKSFSNSNNGYVRSEGAIVFILKSVKKAEQDKDLIKGVLLNTATNCDGKTNGLPLPSSEAQCRLMEKVYKEINLEPSKISYVEAHGTGTKVGDPVEIASISNALALKRNKKLPVGSVKSNLGHLEPAAGLAGLLKGLLCIKNRQIPATIHCQTLNPDIDFQKANIKIINEHCDIDESEQIIIGVNSFGFGGSNAHAVLAEYKEQSKLVKKTDCSKSVLPPFVLSANSEKSLKGLVSKYSKFIECEDLDLYDVAYNLFHNKAKLKFYIVVYGCHNRDDIISTLNSFLDNGKNTPNLFIGSKGKAKGKTGVVFSGNGCQWFGMGKNLLRCSSDIFGYMNDADNIFKELSGFSIIEKIQTETDEQLYSDTEIAQPALLIIQTALVRYLQANGMKFDAVIGHSVGEVAAAWACGALTLKEAVTLIYYKSKVQSRTRHYGKMAVIGCTYDEAKEVIVNLDIEDSVSIAGINSPALISLSGKEEFLNKIQDYCNAEEKYFQLLDLDYPFHSNYMDEIELDFKKLLSGHISPKSTNIDFVSTVYGKQVSGDKLDIDYWWNNIRKPVKFKDGIDELVNSGFANFIEIGTHPIMSRSIGQCAEELHKSVNLFSSVKKHSEEFYELNNSLFNLWFSDDNWNNRIFFPHEADRIALPGYVWDREKYRTVNSDESNGPSSIKLEHPLLGWRLAHNETIWENHLDATNCGELKDHVVGGILVFPAAGFIEMAVAANCLIHDNEVGYIDNMQMISPLILEEEVIRKVQLRVDENGYFNIRSRPRFTENEWAVHVSGRIVKKTYFTDIDGSKAENIFNNEPHHIFSSEEHYNFAKSVGLEYKDKFRTVDSIKFYEDRCKVKLINKLDKDNEYIFGPSLLDGGIHSLISLKCAKENFIEKTGSNSAFLPAGFDRILFKSNGGISSSVNINLLSQTKTSVKADITFYDEDNNILVKLFGARFNVAELINKTKLPTFYEYKPTLLYSYDTKIAKDIKNSLKDLFQHLKHFGTNDIENINNIIEQLFISYIIRAIKNIFPENNISVENEYTKYYKLNWALDILAAEEYLLKSDNNTLIWNKNKEIIVPETIFKLLVDNYSESLSISLLCSRLGQVMEKVLLGKLEINDFISDNKTLYEDIITNNILNSPSKAGFESCLYKLICSLKTDRKINVLEVGSGLYSSHIGNAANANTDNFNYNLASLCHE
ncbi:MAG: acyltransferase domain-containing protein [bacterium]|nr:acyltransferase domain-containing protein [bacterium]